MKFEKITDTQIKIILDIKDMELHNITNKSIIATSTFPQKLLQTMLKTAEKEGELSLCNPELCPVKPVKKPSKLLVEATMPNNTECIFIITKLTTKTISSLDNSFVFKFDSFDDFIALCTFLNNLSDLNLKDFSENFSLIFYNNTYYLYDFDIGKYSILLDYMKETFSEFGTRIYNSIEIEGILNEYGKVIFEDNAIVNCIFHFI